MSVFDGIKIPKLLFETQSKFNGTIQVYQVGDVKKIKVDKIDQSISHTSELCKRLVWGKVVDVLKEEEPTLKNMLILGMGGGTVAHLVSESFKDVEITSVEIDSVMVDIAKQYFEVDKIPHHKILIADAMRVVIEPEVFELLPGTFQAVLVDVFIGEKYPDLGSSGNFLASVKRMVTPGGLVIFNRIYLQHHQDDVNDFVEYVQTSLNNVKCLIVAGYTNSDNILIYGRA